GTFGDIEPEVDLRAKEHFVFGIERLRPQHVLHAGDDAAGVTELGDDEYLAARVGPSHGLLQAPGSFGAAGELQCPCIAAALLCVEMRPAGNHESPATRQVRIHDIHGHAAVSTRLCVAHLEHDVAFFTVRDAAHAHPQGSVGDDIVVADDVFHLGAGGDRERDFGTASSAAQNSAGFALEDLAEVSRLIDVVVVAAGRVGDALHEQLVVVLAEADRRDADTVIGGAFGDAGQLAGAGDADVGLSVGEQNDLIDLPILEGAEYFVKTGQEAARKVGAAAVAQAADASHRGATRIRIDEDGRHGFIDAVGKGDDRNAI